MPDFDPDSFSSTPSTSPSVFSRQYTHSDNSCLEVERTSFTYMGYSIRTDRYRYTEWLAWNGSALAPARPLRLRASELYDHDGDDGTDADAFENVNVVDDHDDVRRELFEVLRRKFDD